MTIKYIATLIALIALAIGISGCERGVEAPINDGIATSEANILDRDIPGCTELLMPVSKPYRLAAFSECATARSADQKRTSVGCEVVRRILSCTSSGDVPRDILRAYQTAEFRAERKEATGN